MAGQGQHGQQANQQAALQQAPRHQRRAGRGASGPQHGRPGQRQQRAPPPGPGRGGGAQRCVQRGQCQHHHRAQHRGQPQAPQCRLPGAAHGAQFGLPHGVAGGQESVRLVERMADQVQHGQLVQAQPAFQHHEAHLRQRGPGQPHLDADARQHHKTGQHGGQQAGHHQQGAGGCGLFKQGRKADQHKAAQVDHAGVQQGRHRGGRLHHLDQPAMHRQQRGAHQHRQRQQHRADLQAGVHALHLHMLQQGGNRAAAHFAAGQHGCAHQARIGQPVGQEFFVRGQRGKRPVGIKAQQPVQRHAGRRPCRYQHHPVVGQHQQLHGSQHAGQRCHVARLARLALQVARRKPRNHGAKPLHQQGHPGRQQADGQTGRDRAHGAGTAMRLKQLQRQRCQRRRTGQHASGQQQFPQALCALRRHAGQRCARQHQGGWQQGQPRFNQGKKVHGANAVKGKSGGGVHFCGLNSFCKILINEQKCTKNRTV